MWRECRCHNCILGLRLNSVRVGKLLFGGLWGNRWCLKNGSVKLPLHCVYLLVSTGLSAAATKPLQRIQILPKFSHVTPITLHLPQKTRLTILGWGLDNFYILFYSRYVQVSLLWQMYLLWVATADLHTVSTSHINHSAHAVIYHKHICISVWRYENHTASAQAFSVLKAKKKRKKKQPFFLPVRVIIPDNYNIVLISYTKIVIITVFSGGPWLQTRK